MVGRIALGILIFFIGTALIGALAVNNKVPNKVKAFVVLALVAYVAVTAVYFLSQFGYV